MELNKFMIKSWRKSWIIGLLLLIQIAPAFSSVYDGDEWSEWSEWSPCSRTCDGGVTQQFRRCKNPNGCHGVSIKRKMCNMQSCNGGGSGDYRGDQCRAFNGMRYSGKVRTWEAIEEPDDPCALVCRAEGTDMVVKLSPKLRDGTRCKMGALHVCVDGKCEAVGCDLKIGSPKKIDACGVCGGDSKSCMSPVYRWDFESNGPCTASCGGGLQPIKIVCRNSLTGDNVENYFCNAGTKPYLETQSCNIQPCEPLWEQEEWSVCSKSCGGGLKIRKVYCAQEKNGTKIKVADKLCHHIRKPSNQEGCNQEPCPQWFAGPWSTCFCDKGYMIRNVQCRDSSNLPSSSCDVRLQPGETKNCDTDCPRVTSPPPTVFNRGPTKKRRVKTTTVDVRDVIQTYPSSTTTTEFIPNVDYNNPDIDNDNDVYVEEELQREHTLPLIQPYPPMDNAVLFDSNALPSEPTFVAGEWSECSASCGEGRRTREVKCKIFLEFSRTIANLPDKECPGPKPISDEPCFGSPCHLGDWSGERLSDVHQAALADSGTSSGDGLRKTLSVGLPPGISIQDMTFSWKVLGYTPCSASCLGGIQEAMIQCVRDYDQRIATPVLCMDKPQPDIATTRTCNDHPCPPRWNVTEFGPCSKPCGGGVMAREVNCIHEVTRGNTVIVPASICPSSIPRTEMLCNTVNCPPYWQPGEWGKCSKPCGGGIRTRTIHCKQMSALGQIIEVTNADAHCISKTKPAETKSCNKKSCSKMVRPVGQQNHDYSSSDPEYRDKVTLPVKGKATVYAGISLRLRCPSGKGMDKGSLIWMKGHEYLKVQPERMELIHKSGILKIKNTTYSDSGIFTCVYNGRPVSNITLMVKPYTGDVNQKDKRPRGRANVHDSTLYADQQVVTPNSKFYESSATSSASSSPQSFFLNSLFSLFCWIRWPLQNMFNPQLAQLLGNDGKMNKVPSQETLEIRSENIIDAENLDVTNSISIWESSGRLKSLSNEDDDELSKVEKLLSKEKSKSLDTKDVEWVVGEWTMCLDSECFNWNTALKRRQVSCEYPNGTSVRENGEIEICDPQEKPVEALECYNPKCLGRWKTQAWTPCNCEFRTRILSCVWFGSGRPAGHACHSLPRPKVTKSCRGPCPIKQQSNNGKKLKAKLRTTSRHHHRHNHNSNPSIINKSLATTTTMKSRTSYNNNDQLIDYWDLYDNDVDV